MPKWAGTLVETSKAFVDPSAMITQMREDSDTLGHHKASILVRKRFRSGVNIAKVRSFPEADIGSDHDLLMMTFHLRLKRISKPKHTKLKFDLEKLKDPNVLETFQAI